MIKAHDIIKDLPRAQRRHLLAMEKKRRESGNWPAWERLPFPAGVPGARGWARYICAAHRNQVFSVLERHLRDGTIHLAISSLSQIRPSWWEAMRIKNEIAGDEATAVEVYPPMSEVVDEADMYHLWVLPARLPFTLGNRPA